MSIVQQNANGSEALLSREEVNGLNPPFVREASEFYAARVYERHQSAGYGITEYWNAVHIEGHGSMMDLGDRGGLFDDSDYASLHFIHQMAAPDSLLVDPLSESRHTQLSLASQSNAERVLEEFHQTYNSIAAYEAAPQAEVTTFHAHLIGLRGLVRNNAGRELAAIASLLNYSIATLQSARPWVVARHNTLAYGHTIAAQLLEFDTVETGTKTALKPVVMTADHRRGYLPTDYQLVDDWLYFQGTTQPEFDQV